MAGSGDESEVLEDTESEDGQGGLDGGDYEPPGTRTGAARAQARGRRR